MSVVGPRPALWNQDILVEIKRIYTNVISDQKIFGIAAKWSNMK